MPWQKEAQELVKKHMEDSSSAKARRSLPATSLNRRSNRDSRRGSISDSNDRQGRSPRSAASRARRSARGHRIVPRSARKDESQVTARLRERFQELIIFAVIGSPRRRVSARQRPPVDARRIPRFGIGIIITAAAGSARVAPVDVLPNRMPKQDFLERHDADVAPTRETKHFEHRPPIGRAAISSTKMPPAPMRHRHGAARREPERARSAARARAPPPVRPRQGRRRHVNRLLEEGPVERLGLVEDRDFRRRTGWGCVACSTARYRATHRQKI